MTTNFLIGAAKLRESETWLSVLASADEFLSESGVQEWRRKAWGPDAEEFCFANPSDALLFKLRYSDLLTNPAEELVRKRAFFDQQVSVFVAQRAQLGQFMEHQADFFAGVEEKLRTLQEVLRAC